MSVKDLIVALRTKAFFQTVKQSVSDKRLRLVGRVPDDKTAQWLIVCQQLLLQAGRGEWSFDLSKWYHLKNGSIVFGWRLIIESPDSIESCLPAIFGAINSAPKVRAVVTEVTLPGVTSLDRNARRAAGIESKKYPPIHAAAGRR